MTPLARRDALMDVLAERATSGLAPERELELVQLLAEFPEVDADHLDLAAAVLLRVWHSEDDLEPMPATLRRAVIARAPRRAVERPSALSDPPAAISVWWRPYAIAATLVMVFLAGRLLRDVPNQGRKIGPSLEQQLAAAADTRSHRWVAQGIEGYAGAQGEIVWSGSRQAGLMRLEGFPPNDPAKRQYQLWIVDPERDARHPVDGGVFDISGPEPVVIPLNLKLPLIAPRAFAITAEQPGGVVVSQGPHLAVATVD
ncbi:MAG: anti-sigma factor [Planctomycetes bacterium]|nr:anti-sigma factor [Planctomycetota bacterium]